MKQQRRTTAPLIGALACATLAAQVLSVGAAQADSAPTEGLPATVTADLLPAPQINGVVWDQEVVGNTVYVGGKFTSTRPFREKAGSGESARSNLMSYDITTGKATSWAPQVNGEIKTVTASPDGKTLYIGGQFTQIDGESAYRLAAFDIASGKRIMSFQPILDYRVNTIAVHGDTVYAGGQFSSASGQKRTNLAAFEAGSGQILPWAPKAQGGQVLGIVVSPDGSKVVPVGMFNKLSGRTAKGWGAVNATSGAVLPWAANKVVTNNGKDVGLYSATTDGKRVYVTAYSFGEAKFEGVAAANWSGQVDWITDCWGDTYDTEPIGDVLYYVGHTHNCKAIGGKTETDPITYMRANAVSTAPSIKGTVNRTGQFKGRPSADFLHWFPDVDMGKYTGTNQGTWTVEGNSDYVVLGGEFPRVNGMAQYGLARFAVADKAPNKVGPEPAKGKFEPKYRVKGDKVVAEVAMPHDMDNEVVKVSMWQGSHKVAETAQKSKFWKTPTLRFTGGDVSEGRHQFVIRAEDAFGNVLQSPIVEVGSGELKSVVGEMPKGEEPKGEEPDADNPGGDSPDADEPDAQEPGDGTPVVGDDDTDEPGVDNPLGDNPTLDDLLGDGVLGDGDDGIFGDDGDEPGVSDPNDGFVVNPIGNDGPVADDDLGLSDNWASDLLNALQNWWDIFLGSSFFQDNLGFFGGLEDTFSFDWEFKS